MPVPLGFKVVEGTKSTGVVIKNSTEGSEFVWIPVDSGTLPSVSGSEPAVVTQTYDLSSSSYVNGADMDSEYLAKAGITEGLTTGVSEKNSELFLAQLKSEYNAMKASVEKYKGFYVGRYEVSNNGGKAASVAKVTPANSMTWYELYALCKTYKTSSVTGSMIWVCQWNAMMTFIGDKASDTGNVAHGSSNFTTMPYQTGGTDYSTNYKIKEGEDGYVKYQDICNNIYDLEGNVSEWTLEGSGNSNRVGRGGYYGWGCA